MSVEKFYKIFVKSNALLLFSTLFQQKANTEKPFVAQIISATYSLRRRLNLVMERYNPIKKVGCQMMKRGLDYIRGCKRAT